MNSLTVYCRSDKFLSNKREIGKSKANEHLEKEKRDVPQCRQKSPKSRGSKLTEIFAIYPFAYPEREFSGVRTGTTCYPARDYFSARK